METYSVVNALKVMAIIMDIAQDIKYTFGTSQFHENGNKFKFINTIRTYRIQLI